MGVDGERWAETIKEGGSVSVKIELKYSDLTGDLQDSKSQNMLTKKYVNSQ